MYSLVNNVLRCKDAKLHCIFQFFIATLQEKVFARPFSPCVVQLHRLLSPSFEPQLSALIFVI